jgi:hypothetical protein
LPSVEDRPIDRRDVTRPAEKQERADVRGLVKRGLTGVQGIGAAPR